MIRKLLLTVAILVGVFAAVAYPLLTTYEEAPVDPRWADSAQSADSTNSAGTAPETAPGAVIVRYTGTSTLLFSDGETAWMTDGWFSRFGPLRLLLGTIGPDLEAIERGLAHNQVDRLAVVIPVHSHYDHAMDSPEVALRTGAILWGSESTANIGRGWGLDEARIRVARDRESLQFGDFRITLIETKHFEFPDPAIRERALADPEIEAPLVPPVGAFDYRVGQPYAIHVTHPRGSFLIQASAGYVKDGLDGLDADVVFLGIGGLGSQSAEYRESYWRETVEGRGAREVIPIHWDSLTGPIEGPFTGEVRAASFLSSGGDLTRAFLEHKAATHPELRFRTLPRYAPVVLF